MLFGVLFLSSSVNGMIRYEGSSPVMFGRGSVSYRSSARFLFQTNVRDILRNQAILDSLRKRVSYEFIDVYQLVNQLTHHNHEVFIILQFILFLNSILYDLNPESVRLYIKLSSLSDYKDIEKRMNILVLCIAIIMMKNIENALWFCVFALSLRIFFVNYFL